MFHLLWQAVWICITHGSARPGHVTYGSDCYYNKCPVCWQEASQTAVSDLVQSLSLCHYYVDGWLFSDGHHLPFIWHQKMSFWNAAVNQLRLTAHGICVFLNMRWLEPTSTGNEWKPKTVLTKRHMAVDNLSQIDEILHQDCQFGSPSSPSMVAIFLRLSQITLLWSISIVKHLNVFGEQ